MHSSSRSWPSRSARGRIAPARTSAGARDDESGRLDEPEPLEVRLDVRVEAGHQFVSGQR